MKLKAALHRLTTRFRHGAWKRQLLFAVFVWSGVAIILSVFLFSVEAKRMEECIHIAARKLDLSKTLLELAGDGNIPEDRRYLKDLRAEFAESFVYLERCFRSPAVPPPSSARVLKELGGLQVRWSEVEGPLGETVEKRRPEPQRSRLLKAKAAALVGGWQELTDSLIQSRDALQDRLLYGLIAACLWCLLLILAGAAFVDLCARRALDLIEKAAQRGKDSGPLSTGSLVAEQELESLPRFKGLPGTLSRLLALFPQHRQTVSRVLEHIPSGLLVLSSGQHVLAVNEAFCRMFQLPRAAILDKPFQQVNASSGLGSWIRQVLLYQTWTTSYTTKFRDERSRALYRATLTRLQPGTAEDTLFLLTVDDQSQLSNLQVQVEEFKQLYQDVLETIAEGVVLVGEDGIILEANDEAARMFGYRKDEMAAKPVRALTRPGAGSDGEHPLESYLQPGKWRLEGSMLECEFARKDGTAFPAEVRLSERHQGGRGFFVLSLRDVTDGKRAEMLSRDRLQVIELIARNQPLEKVLSSLTEMIERQLPGSLCAIMLRRDDRLYPAAAPNLPEDFVQSLAGLPIGPSSASCGTAAFEGKVVTITDIASDPLWEDYRDAALAHDLRASWSVPVFSSDGLIVGTIAVYTRTISGEITRFDSELLQMASRLAAVCIEQRQLTGQLAYQARHDPLTGLPNRISFEDWLKRALAHSRRHGQFAGILSIDLDRFKLVNDTLGHAVGDGLLHQIARRLEGCLRETDIVARWGGDEFMIGLMELRGRQDARAVTQKLLDVLRAPVEVEGHKLSVTATIGISIFPEDGQDLAALLRNADRAMYRAKNSGRNGFQYYTPELGEVALHRLELESHLGGALERGELLLHYQPQFDVRNGKLAGMEALLRWNHPRLGFVPPAKFIPIAEESGLIIPIGAWVLEQACRQVKAFEEKSHADVKVAVNVSSLQFGRPDFVDFVAETLRNTGINPALLELELTESLVMRDVEESAPRMARLRQLGVGISIDDFGTGYSSLSYLQRLPIDNLKIDQSFVREMGTSPKTPALVESIVALAHSLGMTTTAEGVETMSQLTALRTTGCQQAQGFLLGRPLPAEKLLSLVMATPESDRWSRFMITIPTPRTDATRAMNGTKLILRPAPARPPKAALSVVPGTLRPRRKAAGD